MGRCLICCKRNSRMNCQRNSPLKSRESLRAISGEKNLHLSRWIFREMSRRIFIWITKGSSLLLYTPDDLLVEVSTGISNEFSYESSKKKKTRISKDISRYKSLAGWITTRYRFICVGILYTIPWFIFRSIPKIQRNSQVCTHKNC